jgi:hypothetical protein
MLADRHDHIIVSIHLIHNNRNSSKLLPDLESFTQTEAVVCENKSVNR